jgi:hypothetical protein
MTYFKDKDSSKPQGTIPLQDCSIDLPNDGRKSFLLRGRGRDVDGYEMRCVYPISQVNCLSFSFNRITHSSRRPFLLVFLTGERRTDWFNFLTQYVAVSFLSPAYLLAQTINTVNGLLSLPPSSSRFTFSCHPNRWTLCCEEDHSCDWTTSRCHDS